MYDTWLTRYEGSRDCGNEVGVILPRDAHEGRFGIREDL